MTSSFDTFLAICHRAYERRMVAAMDGNLSMRLDDHRILCTPHGVCKGEVMQDDLIVVDTAGRLLEGHRRATTEILLHLAYYTARSDVMAVIHAHPVHATALAASGRRIPDCVFPEVMLTMGAVPLAPYATPSTPALPESLAPFVGRHDVVLLQNHGVVAAGSNIHDAWFKLEKLEHTAEIVIAAAALGGPRPLTDAQVEDLVRIASASYGIELSTKTLRLGAQHDGPGV